MSGRFFLSGTTPLYEGEPQPLSTLTFSLTGTSTPQDTYTTPGLTVANANPVVADANGYFGEILMSRSRYKAIWKNAGGTTLKTWDPVDKDVVFTRGAGLPSDPHPGQKHANTSDGKTYEYKLDTAAWLDLGTTDSVGNTASVTEQLTGTSASVYATPDSVAGLWQRGANIASSGTLSLPAGGGGVFNITGTTTINGIGSAQGGRTVKLYFAGALTLTHGASFILPGAANITTVAGDCAEFVNEAAQDASGSSWRCFNYHRSSGSSVNMTDFLAAQSDQETGTSTVKYVTSGRQHFHPTAPKAWANFTPRGTNGTCTLNASYNVTSVERTGAGAYTVTFTTAFSSASYAALCSVGSTTIAHNLILKTNTKATGTCTLDLISASTGSGSDLGTTHDCAFFGDL
jgi:hypothetical protein